MKLFKQLFKIWALVMLGTQLALYPAAVNIFIFVVTPVLFGSALLAGLNWLINGRDLP
jgi:hypothetical protein